MAYRLEMTLFGLPKMTNRLTTLTHWERSTQAKNWKIRVINNVVINRGRPEKPLTKAKLTLLRFSSAKNCDYDGLVSGFKHIIDGLVAADIIANDTREVIGTPHYDHFKAPPGKGYVKIIVEEIVDGI